MKGIITLTLLTAYLASAQTTGTITGRVQDSETRSPIAGVNVTVPPFGTTTDEEGRFELTALPAGRHVVHVSHVGYQRQAKTAEVRAGEHVELQFQLVPRPILVQPITVAASRGRVGETPATFSTLEAADLRERYTMQDIPVLLSELPSITFYSEGGHGIGYTYMNIRGFDSRRVAVMVNGIPQNDPEDHNVYWLDMPDLAASVEDIQVQRGGGSAFYGPPAIGGSVNVVTASPARERSFTLSSGVGSYNTRRYAATFSSGLIDNTYGIHARLAKLRSDGYRDRAWVDFNSYFLSAARFDENMTTQINLYGGPIADGLAYYGIPKADVKDREKRKTNPIARDEEIENFSQPHYEVFHEWRLSESLTLNNALFLVLGNGFFDYDGSWAPYSYYRITPEFGFDVAGDPDTLFLPGALIRAFVGNRQYGWLPRATVKHGTGELIIGAELRIHRSEHWGRLQWTQGLPPDVPWDYRYYQYRGAKDIASVYAQEMLELRNDLTLMLNLQYVYNRYRLYGEKFVGTDFSVPYHFVNPRAGMLYRFTDELSGYLSVAYTQREPRLKNLYAAAEASTPPSWGAVLPQFETDARGEFDFSRPLVKPEALFNVELGGRWSSTDVEVSVNGYWMEFADEIVKSGQVDRFGQPITGNADRTRHIGVELEARLALARGLMLGGNATLSRNRFVRHTHYFEDGSSVSLQGNPIAGFPDVLGNLRLTVREGHSAVSLSGRFVGKQYTDNFKDAANTVDPFIVVDGWISYSIMDILSSGVGVEARLQVNNIFDRLYAAYGEGSSYFVGAERNVFFNLSLSL